MRKSILLFLLFVFLLNTLTIVSFAEEKEVPINDFHTQEMFSYINDNYLNVSEYADGKQELSIPRGIICDFSSDDIGTSDSYIFQKATDETYSDPIIIENITERIYILHNLKLGEHLYWRAATSYEMLDKSPIHEITVTDIGPRNCYIDGVTNVRDIGGYKSNLIENSKIRQGYYYRGANLNGITDEGKRQMTEELGIKAEIDIRDVYQCLGPYVDGVEYNTYIEQLWAEAMVIYRSGNYSLCLSPEMDKEMNIRRVDFMAEDTTTGMIQAWLDEYKGNYVCTYLIYNECFKQLGKPDPKAKTEINSIMNNTIKGWKQGKQHRYPLYGQQRSWERVNEPDPPDGGWTDLSDVPCEQLGIPEEWLKPPNEG